MPLQQEAVTIMAAKKKTRRSLRSLRGTPTQHERLMVQHLHAARRPVSFGCRAAIESLGAAKAEYNWITKADEKSDSEVLRAFREASKAIEERCTCRSAKG